MSSADHAHMKMYFIVHANGLNVNSTYCTGPEFNTKMEKKTKPITFFPKFNNVIGTLLPFHIILYIIFYTSIFIVGILILTIGIIVNYFNYIF